MEDQNSKNYLDLSQDYFDSLESGRKKVFPFDVLFGSFDTQELVEELIDCWKEAGYNSLIIDTIHYWRDITSDSTRENHPEFLKMLWHIIGTCGYSFSHESKDESAMNRLEMIVSKCKSLDDLYIVLIEDFLNRGRYSNQLEALYAIGEDYKESLINCKPDVDKDPEERVKVLRMAIDYLLIQKVLENDPPFLYRYKKLDELIQELNSAQTQLIKAKHKAKEREQRRQDSYRFFAEFENAYSKVLKGGAIFQFSDNQKDAIIKDEKNILLRSSAGSGKTAVLVSRFFFLLHLGIDPTNILFIAYTNEVCNEINCIIKKLWNDDVSFDKIWPKNDFSANKEPGPAKTFHSLALSIIDACRGSHRINDTIENKTDGSVDHNRGDILLQRGVFMNDSSFICSIEKYDDYHLYGDYLEDNPEGEKREYISYYLNDGHIGSLRSRREKWIYEFLIQNGVNFSYEMEHQSNHPDFTIWQDGHKFLYEHFAKRRGQIDNREYGDTVDMRIRLYEQQFGFYFLKTFGENENGQRLSKDELLNELSKELKLKGIRTRKLSDKELDERREPQRKEQLIRKYIRYYREIRTIILDDCLSFKKVSTQVRNLGGWPAFFWKYIFKPLETEYRALLRGNNNDTDFSDCIDWARTILEKKDSTIDTTSIKKYSHILIDEYQDITQNQYRMIKGLAAYGNSNMFAVGDDWQSIYSFSNSDLGLFIQFDKTWKGGCIFDLSETFRFGGQLLSVSKEFVLDTIDRTSHKRQNAYLTEREISGREIETFLRYRPYSFCYDKSVSYKNNLKAAMEIQLNEVKNCLSELSLAEFQNSGKHNQKVAIISRFSLSEYSNEIKSIFKVFDWIDCDKSQGYTMHSSKGITVDYAFVINCNNKSIPYISPRHDEFVNMLRQNIVGANRMDEERRLFYVAITRAIKGIYLIYENGRESQFVKEIKQIIPEEVG